MRGRLAAGEHGPLRPAPAIGEVAGVEHLKTGAEQRGRLAVGQAPLGAEPGPGTPRDAGVSMDMIRAFAGQVPVLVGRPGVGAL